MNQMDFISEVQQNEDKVPDGYIIINGATAHEFKAKWDEYMSQYNDTKIVWSKLAALFQFEYLPMEDRTWKDVTL